MVVMSDDVTELMTVVVGVEVGVVLPELVWDGVWGVVTDVVCQSALSPSKRIRALHS